MLQRAGHDRMTTPADGSSIEQMRCFCCWYPTTKCSCWKSVSFKQCTFLPSLDFTNGGVRYGQVSVEERLAQSEKRVAADAQKQFDLELAELRERIDAVQKVWRRLLFSRNTALSSRCVPLWAESVRTAWPRRNRISWDFQSVKFSHSIFLDAISPRRGTRRRHRRASTSPPWRIFASDRRRSCGTLGGSWWLRGRSWRSRGTRHVVARAGLPSCR